MNKHTLYISFDGLSDPLGQSQILPYLCGIAAKGYNITILSCEKKERISEQEPIIRELINKLPISWHYILYDEKGNFLSRFLYIRQLSALAKRITIEKKIELIHCRSYLSALIGLSFKRKYKIPFVFDMRGFWADERMDGEIWNKKKIVHRLFYKYFKNKEKQFIHESDAIVSLTEAAVKELNLNHPDIVMKNKITVIPCCTNTHLFNPQSVKQKSSIAYCLPKDHVIIYTGSIGTWYYTKQMIDCILVWKKIIPSIKLLIVTKDIERLKNILSNYSEEDQSLIYTTESSYTQIPAYLASARAAMFFIKPAYSKIASSPTKMAECWAMNLPIITNAGIGDNDLYFNKYNGGILINEFHEKEYLEAGYKYLDIQNKNFSYRNIALEFFDKDIAIEKYNSIYYSLIG